jgi:hypothetical protein
MVVSERNSYSDTVSKGRAGIRHQQTPAVGQPKQSFSRSSKVNVEPRAKSTVSSKAKLEQVHTKAAAFLGDALLGSVHRRNRSPIKTGDDDLLSSNYKLSKNSYNHSKELLNPRFTRSILRKEGNNQDLRGVHLLVNQKPAGGQVPKELGESGPFKPSADLTVVISPQDSQGHPHQRQPSASPRTTRRKARRDPSALFELVKGSLAHTRSLKREVHQLKVINQNQQITIPNDYLTRNGLSEAQNTKESNTNTYIRTKESFCRPKSPGNLKAAAQRCKTANRQLTSACSGPHVFALLPAQAQQASSPDGDGAFTPRTDDGEVIYLPLTREESQLSKSHFSKQPAVTEGIVYTGEENPGSKATSPQSLVRPLMNNRSLKMKMK